MIGVSLVMMTLAGAPVEAGATVDYAREVKPVLAARCLACHGALKQEANLRLDTAAAIKLGGDSGPAITAGDPKGSLILERVTNEDPSLKMPPAETGTPLTAEELDRLTKWISEGAVAPTDEVPEADPKEHWSFQAPSEPLLTIRTTDHETPIDVILGARQLESGVQPQPRAESAMLLRRVTLDLVGLPPTPAEREEFLTGTRPDSYDRLVDRLLAAPAHGERWGRHWMDVWRYSDWWGLGAEVRNSQKHIWHWRDWIVESLNADVPYDEMVRQMLAADELYPTDDAKLRATGYLVRSYFKFNRNSWLDETVEHTAKAFLGLTINCTKCHDHKYDPFAQDDYYRLRAFFEPYQVRTDELPGETDLEKNGLPRVFDMHADTPTYLFVRGNEQDPKTDRSFAPGLPTLLEEVVGKPTFAEILLPPQAHHPGLRAWVLDDHLAVADRELQAARAELEKAKSEPAAVEVAKSRLVLAEKMVAAAELQGPALLARAAADRARFGLDAGANFSLRAREAVRAERRRMTAKAAEDVARAEFELVRAAPEKKGDVEKKVAGAKEALTKAEANLAEPGEEYTTLQGALKAPESNLETEDSRKQPYPSKSTGRRTALANWITSDKNPLTNRVAVNHVWTRHFGTALVATMFDLGRKGKAPLHQDVLDALAIEFAASGSDMKHLHRLLVTSATYRRTASAANATPECLAKDASNTLYWRMNSRRMEAQVVRDTVLSLAGDLDDRMGGASLDPVNDTENRRRSIYFVHSHNDQNKFLATFDDACVRECYMRGESIVPQQALALANSRLVLTASEKLASQLLLESANEDDRQLIQQAFTLVLGTSASVKEVDACTEALAEFQKLHADKPADEAKKRAVVALVHALLNHNDFVTIR